VHPGLIAAPPREENGFTVAEVFAYYEADRPDEGTVLRFVERTGASAAFPGMELVDHEYPPDAVAAFNDHWVSNVFDRERVLRTFEETLGFTSKVNFNAGVVAAGEAQIESTVTGNTPTTALRDAQDVLKDQSQVFLPINNALSSVGHVHWYLDELGQGVQHVACRVEDLVAAVSRARRYLALTGEGCTFLKIPASYYGELQPEDIPLPEAHVLHRALAEAGIIEGESSVRLDARRCDIQSVYESNGLPAEKRDETVELIMRARYSNMYNMLGDQLTEEQYVAIATNQILIDVQGDDVLCQIFTAPVLQAEAGEEAPFFELIQRVCSCTSTTTALRPGCGGFGIRNFITLFLSIESTKAADALRRAVEAGDEAQATLERKRVALFAAQLDESNPVLTAISDAMTAEGHALDSGDFELARKHAAAKDAGQEKLQQISSRYKDMMKDLRVLST
jgi:hypothetical protein